MTKRFQLDSHKLQYHPRLVADFLDGKEIIPLNAEISITDSCNHRCLFCNFEYLGHSGVSLPVGRVPTLVREMAGAGVKTMTFAGMGEPLLHPDVFSAFRIGHSLGMDLALSTNGVLLKQEQMEEMADMLSWTRFSINGGTPESYAAVHRCSPAEFGKVIGNLEKLAAIKRRTGSSLTLGTQCVLVDENYADIAGLAAKVKEAGADYFVVKHFYPREEGDYKPGMAFRSEVFLKKLEGLAAELSGDSFFMTVRDTAKLKRIRPYMECFGLPFFVYISENGLLYTCFSHQEDKRTAIGSILERDFGSLWHSAEKEAALRHLNAAYDKNLCQSNCRHHQINLWLHQLKNPPMHVNFI